MITRRNKPNAQIRPTHSPSKLTKLFYEWHLKRMTCANTKCDKIVYTESSKRAPIVISKTVVERTVKKLDTLFDVILKSGQREKKTRATTNRNCQGSTKPSKTKRQTKNITQNQIRLWLHNDLSIFVNKLSLLSKASNRAIVRTKVSAMTFSNIDIAFLVMIKGKLKHTKQLWIFLKKYINASTSKKKLILVQMDTFMNKQMANNPFLKTANLRDAVFFQLYHTVKKSCKKRGGENNIIEQIEIMKEYNRTRTCATLWNWLIISIFFPPLLIITMIRLVISRCF